MEGMPDEDDGRRVADRQRPGHGCGRRSEPNFSILLGMTLLALALATAVLVLTAIW